MLGRLENDPPRVTREVLGSLELGRFLAASIVVLTHFLGELPRYASGVPNPWLTAIRFPAPLAVQYFFVLSGFVMMTAHRKDMGHWHAVPLFWWRRACRIYPMYWLALGLVAIIIHSDLSLHRVFVLVSLRPSPAAEFVTPAWSLRYEMAFYIAFGLCLVPYIGWLLLAAWVCSVFWLWRPAAMASFLLCKPTILLGTLASHNPAFFSPFEFYFFMGLAAGYFRLTSRALGWGFLAAGLAILIGAGSQFQWGYIYGSPLVSAVTGCGLAGVILGLSTLERGGQFHPGSYARTLGAISYPLYILHTAIMFLLWNMSLHQQWHFSGPYLYLFGAAYLGTIFAFAAAAAFLIDKPLQKFLRNIRMPAARSWPRFRTAP